MAVTTYYMPRHHRSSRGPRILVNLVRGRVKTFARMAADKVAIDAPLTTAERNAVIAARGAALFAHFEACEKGCATRGLCDDAVKYMDRTRAMQGIGAYV